MQRGGPTAKRIVDGLELTRDPVVDQKQLREFADMVIQLLLQERIPLGDDATTRAAIELAYAEVLGISVLLPLWRDDTVDEILVDSSNKIFVERAGQIEATPLRFRDLPHAQSVARALAGKTSDRALSPKNPIVTADLPGARITLLIDKVVPSGVAWTIRKFKPSFLSLADMVTSGSLDPTAVEFLVDCVRARANILISGGTGTGKTTLINALSQHIPDGERTITIEDARELQLASDLWLPLVSKEASSADDEVSIQIGDLLTAALRMRPDRIVVGEIRRPYDADVMLNAANTGHDGSMTTIHANSASKAVNFRLSGFIRSATGQSQDLAVRDVAAAINLVLQIKRSKGVRWVSEIAVSDVDFVTDDYHSVHPIFHATLVAGDDGTPRTQFKQVGLVGADTDLGMKLIDAGFTRWVEDTPQ